jgi:hypothetical protein
MDILKIYKLNKLIHFKYIQQHFLNKFQYG